MVFLHHKMFPNVSVEHVWSWIFMLELVTWVKRRMCVKWPSDPNPIGWSWIVNSSLIPLIISSCPDFLTDEWKNKGPVCKHRQWWEGGVKITWHACAEVKSGSSDRYRLRERISKHEMFLFTRFKFRSHKHIHVATSHQVAKQTF